MAWPKRNIGLILTFLLFAVLTSFVISQALNKQIDHDEDQYMACASLINEGMHPYQDFHFHHTPYLSYVYAGLFSLSPYKIVSVRLFSALCAIAYLLLIFLMLRKQFSYLQGSKANIFSISALFLLCLSPVFSYSATLSWSHDFPILLIMLGFFLFLKFFENEKRGYLFWTGFLLGLALFSRLSYLYAIIPFLIILFVVKPFKLKKVFQNISVFISGGVMSSIPLLLLISSKGSFDVFWYSIYDYHFRMDPVFLKEVGYMLTPQQKYQMYISSLVNKQVLIPLVSFFIMGVFLLRNRNHLNDSRDLLLLFLIVLFTLIGILTKEVLLKQYFYVVVIFLILGFYFYMARIKLPGIKPLNYLVGVFLLVVILWDFYHVTHAWGRFGSGYLHEIHENGLKINEITDDHRIVTLSPLYCIEGGCRIYPEFANGSFSWRVASCKKVKDKRLTSIKNFDAFYNKHKPEYLYTGHEPLFEKSLVQYFTEKGFVPVPIGEQGFLYQKPLIDKSAEE